MMGGECSLPLRRPFSRKHQSNDAPNSKVSPQYLSAAGRALDGDAASLEDFAGVARLHPERLHVATIRANPQQGT